MKKKEILEEIKALEQILEFHSTFGVIKNPKEFEKHIDDILDRIKELKEMLKEE